MDLIFLDSDFNNIPDPVDTYSSFIWCEKWYETGNFDLVLSYDKFDTIRQAQYIYNQDEDKTAVVTQHEIADYDLIVNGKMLEYIMSWRVIDTEVMLNDTIENVIYTMVTRFAMTGDRTIPKLTLAEKYGFLDTYEGVAEEGKTLEQWLYDTLRPFDMTYRIKYDYLNDVLVFSIVKGVDRSQEQDINTWAIFSTDFENIADISYITMAQDYKNYAYVVGEYEDNRVVEIIDESNGGERRELYINPSISNEDDDISTLAKYRNVLRQRGVEALAEYRDTETVSCVIVDDSSFELGADYNLGDTCDIIISDIGLITTKQITEIETVYDENGKQIHPRFGENLLTEMQYIEREMKK